MLRELWRRRDVLLREIKQARGQQEPSAQTKAYIEAGRVQLDAINHLFGLQPNKDVMVEKWSDQIERGEDLDLGEHVSRLKMSDKMRAHIERLKAKKG